MSRWRAFAIHLILSACVMAVFLAITVLLWFPGPLFSGMGTLRLLGIVLIVDLVLGPLLTLLVFKSGKHGLVLDLTVIAMLQIAALAYGAWTVQRARPAFVVFDGAAIQVLAVNDVTPAAKASPPYNQLPWWGPEWAYIESDASALIDDFIASLMGKTPQVLDTSQYLSPDEHRAEIWNHAKPLSETPEGLSASAYAKLQEQSCGGQERRWMRIQWRQSTGIALLTPEARLCAMQEIPIVDKPAASATGKADS